MSLNELFFLIASVIQSLAIAFLSWNARKTTILMCNQSELQHDELLQTLAGLHSHITGLNQTMKLAIDALRVQEQTIRCLDGELEDVDNRVLHLEYKGNASPDSTSLPEVKAAMARYRRLRRARGNPS